MKIRSPTKRINKNASKFDKSAKSSPKKIAKSEITHLTDFNQESGKILNRRNIKIKIKEGSLKNVLGNITDNNIWVTDKCKDNKENDLFKQIKNISDSNNSYFANKKLLTEIFKNKAKQNGETDTEFLSDDETDEDNQSKFNNLKREDSSKFVINQRYQSVLTQYPDVEKHIHEADWLKSFFFMPFNSGKVEIVEIPKCSEDLRSKVKIHNNMYTSDQRTNSRGSRINSTHSRQRIPKDNDTSEIISRNNSNIIVSNSTGSKSKY